jgi:hypothetical protein
VPPCVTSLIRSARAEERTTIDVPAAAEDLTPVWLTHALREDGVIDSATVVEASVAAIGADQAFAGQPLRVTLRYDSDEPDAPATLVAKLPATALPMRRALSGLGWYETEIRFYEEIAPNFGTRTPRRYFTAMEPDELNYVLLMEDITTGTVGNQIAGASLHQAEIAIDELARIHSAWWNDRRLDDLNWMRRGAVRSVDRADFWAGFYERNWPVAQELMADILPQDIVPLAEQLGPYYVDLVGDAGDSPRTLVHGDFRLDNIFFTSDDTPPTIIDWQLTTAGRGGYDLAYFLGTNLVPELRQAHEEELLHRYHETIAATDAKYSYDICRNDYLTGLMLVFGFWIQTAGASTYPEAGYPLRDSALTRVSQALLDLDVISLLD